MLAQQELFSMTFSLFLDSNLPYIPKLRLVYLMGTYMLPQSVFTSLGPHIVINAHTQTHTHSAGAPRPGLAVTVFLAPSLVGLLSGP